MTRYLALTFALLATPSLANGAEAALGRELFEALCVSCHLQDGSGAEAKGVDIRGLSEARVKRAVQGFDAMPGFELSAEEIVAITAWLSALAEGAAE